MRGWKNGSSSRRRARPWRRCVRLFHQIFNGKFCMKTVPIILLTLAIAVPITWLAASKKSAGPKSANQPTGAERKLLYYQSAMHPWIKSDKPGRCTICGMELTPVYEGDAQSDSSVVSLTQSMIQALHVETVEVQKRALVKTLNVSGTV